MRKCVAVFALQERGDCFIKGMLIVCGRERAGDGPSFGVVDVFGHLISKRALAEAGEPLPERIEVPACAGVLSPEGMEVTEKLRIDQG